MQSLQPKRQRDVPHPLGAWMNRIAIVSDRWVPVVDLKKPVAADLHQILRRDRPVEIRMIHVRKHPSACGFPLLQDGVDILLHYLKNVGAFDRLELLANVHRADVHWNFSRRGADFFSHHEQKFFRHLEFAPEFAERFETHHLSAFHRLLLDPIWPKPFQIFIKRRYSGRIGRDWRPLLSLLSNIVV